MYCECGCGELTAIAKQTRTDRGWIKGQPKRYIANHQLRAEGTWIADSGYTMVYMPDHPRANSKGTVREHIVIVEKVLGKRLPLKSQIHHRNEIRSDNRHENLIVCEDVWYHQLIHKRTVAFRETGDVHSRRCRLCKQWVFFNNPDRVLRILKNGTEVVAHRSCENTYNLNRYYSRKIRSA